VSDAVSRLARSRQAILEEFAPPSQRSGQAARAGGLTRLGAAARTWWRYHPARLGLDMATPFLSEYAGRYPGRFLAMAAAGGALVAIFRPWRVISVSLLVAAAKSSRLPTLLLSVLATLDAPGERQRGE
jgi:hypothetical protein